MDHELNTSNLTIVVRNPQGVIVKNETFNFSRESDREPLINGRTSRG